jgi:hypothetical protein
LAGRAREERPGKDGFVGEWKERLNLASAKLRAELVSRDREMVRRRNWSPLYRLADGVDFGDHDRASGSHARRAESVNPAARF